MPIAGDITAPTRWQCIVLDETKAKEVMCWGPRTPKGPKRVVARAEVSSVLADSINQMSYVLTIELAGY